MTTPDDTTTVVFDPAQLAVVRREMIRSAADSMRNAAEKLAALAEKTWPARVLTQDAMGAVRTVMADLDALDVLGWPDDEEAPEAT